MHLRLRASSICFDDGPPSKIQTNQGICNEIISSPVEVPMNTNVVVTIPSRYRRGDVTEPQLEILGGTS